MVERNILHHQGSSKGRVVKVASYIEGNSKMCYWGQAQLVSHEKGNRKLCADGPVETLCPDKDSYSSTRGKVKTSSWHGAQVERYVCLANFTLQMEGIYFVQWPTNAQLIYKLSYSSYMLQHYCIFLRELVISTLPSYTSISNASCW